MMILVLVSITLSFLEKKIGVKNNPHYIEWPKLQIYSNSTHAEMAAIVDFLRKNKKNIKNTKSSYIPKFPKTLYVFSFNKNKKTRMSKPCADCLKLLKYYGIKKVIYSIYDDVVFEKVDDIDSEKSRGNKY
jgi:deoxycytidylate deaminase